VGLRLWIGRIFCGAIEGSKILIAPSRFSRSARSWIMRFCATSVQPPGPKGISVTLIPLPPALVARGWGKRGFPHQTGFGLSYWLTSGIPGVENATTAPPRFSGIDRQKCRFAGAPRRSTKVSILPDTCAAAFFPYPSRTVTHLTTPEERFGERPGMARRASV
jgi:hypothetical protein